MEFMPQMPCSPSATGGLIWQKMLNGYSDLSPLPNTKSTAISYFPCCCNPSPMILQSLHGYNVYAHVRRIQVHHSELLLTHLLGYATKGNQKNLRELDTTQLHLSLGPSMWNHNQQWLAFLKALAYLEKHYHIKHIQISGYNSWENGLIEQSHFNVWQAIVEACNEDKSRWSLVAFSVFLAEQVMIKCKMVSLFCSDWHLSPPSDRYCTSKLPPTPFQFNSLDYRPHCKMSYYLTKMMWSVIKT